MVKGYDFRSERFEVETVYTAPPVSKVRELALVGSPAEPQQVQFA